MRVLVTGGCGFIGSHVVDYLLAKGHHVMAVDNFFSGRDHWLESATRPEIRQVDITQRRALSAAFQEWKPDAVFHLAGYPYIPFCEKDPVAAYDLNIVGTYNVLALSWNSGVQRFFFASSADVYAPSSGAHREDDPTAPITVHGRSKLLAESLCRGALEWGWSTSMVIGRIFNAVGRRATAPHLVPEIMKHMSAAWPIQSLGDPSAVRDFIDVRSLAQALTDVTLASDGCELCNLGSGVSTTVQQMADLIMQTSGRDLRVLASGSRQQVSKRKALIADTSRLKKLIGYAISPADEATILKVLAEYELPVQGWPPAVPALVGRGHSG